MTFRNRRDAGRLLAARLEELRERGRWAEPIVLGLPRGGVPVAAEVARALDAPLDVIVARKIGAPGEPEIGIGAIAGEDPPLFDRRALTLLGIDPDDLAADVSRERKELHRREDLYRYGRPPLALSGRTVLLVDDGLATGVTARAALRRVRAGHPERLILAVPVCDSRAADALRGDTDEFVCLQPHRYLHAVGIWYEDFRQVSDREVTDLLQHQPAAG
jgi:predicted phosphoribosyltransferase